MKPLPLLMSLPISLCCGSLCLGADRPATAQIAPATQADSVDVVEMVPPASHWPTVVVSVSLGLFVLAAIIGPVVRTQVRES